MDPRASWSFGSQRLPKVPHLPALICRTSFISYGEFNFEVQESEVKVS